MPTLEKAPTISSYSVAPFSLWKTRVNSVRGITGCECGICGKQVKQPFKHIGIVVDGGARWASNEEAAKANFTILDGYMGEFPIGPNCHKRYLLIKS